jgi:NADH dehydrogenase
MATRIVILGGGFSGFYTAYHLQKIWGRDDAVEITLVSRNNYFEITPLLFEAGSGILDPRHAVVPVRPLFRTARFVEADVTGIDLDRRTVAARLVDRYPIESQYDHLVLALGGVTNTNILPGANEHGMTFKTMADAITLRNHVIRLFERADVEADGAVKRSLMSCVVIGGGFVGLELMGELTDFLPAVSRAYPHVDPQQFRYELIEAGPHIAGNSTSDWPDMPQTFFGGAAYASARTRASTGSITIACTSTARRSTRTRF